MTFYLVIQYLYVTDFYVYTYNSCIIGLSVLYPIPLLELALDFSFLYRGSLYKDAVPKKLPLVTAFPESIYLAAILRLTGLSRVCQMSVVNTTLRLANLTLSTSMEHDAFHLSRGLPSLFGKLMRIVFLCHQALW